MTSIKISSSYEELEMIESLSKGIFRENEIPVETQISEFRTDSIEAEIVLPVLSVTFSGVIAVVQIVNLVLNIQEKRNKTIAQKDTPISIKIETSNGKELDLKISGNTTNEEIKKCLNSVQQFVDDFLQDHDGISLKNSQLGETVNSTDIEKINLLFRGLLSNLTDIREWKSLPPKGYKGRIFFESTFDGTSLREFICESRERKIYLHYEEAKSCKGFFYILERENVLAFHEDITDFRMVDMENIFVRYEIEELSLFKKLIHHNDFILSNSLSLAIAENSSETISILLLSADPSDATRLRLGEEFREIQDKLQLAKLRERFRLDQRMSVRPVDISQSLLDLQPQIVHFSGHGLTSGELCFENKIGQVHPVSPDALAALFEQFTNQVKCVLLSACYSEAQAVAIVKHIDYVIGMNQAIGDKAAITFAIGFYQALGAGRTIREAYKLGCVQIRLQSIPEHLTPIFLERNT
jgi:hypothetical protein